MLDQDQKEPLGPIKVVLYGPERAGKSKIISQLEKREFDELYRETIGVEFVNLYLTRSEGIQKL